MDLEMSVGSGKSGVGDGSPIVIRGGKTGEVVFGSAHGKLFEAASRGNLYIASNAVAGRAHGTAFGTTCPISLWNPAGSGVLLSIQRAIFGYVSGTLGAGFYAWGQNLQGSSAPSGTELTPVNALIGGAARGRGRVWDNTNASGATPTLIRPSMSYGAMTASTANALLPAVIDEVDGEIVVYPGGLIALQGIGTAGTSPLLVHSIVWEEIPLT